MDENKMGRCESSSKRHAQGGSFMKRRFLAPALLLTFLAVQLGLAVGRAEAPKHFLWEVRSDGATVYLFGSIHYMRPEMYPLADPIEEAFAKADKLVMEIDTSKNKEEQQALTLKYALYPAGDSLRNHLEPETLRALQAKLDEYGLNQPGIYQCRPWFLASLLAMVEMELNGYSSEEGVDAYFLRRASGKEVLELETFEEQLQLLASFDDLMLVETLAELDRLEEDVAETVDAWSRGDVEALEAITYEDLDDPKYAEYYERFFYARQRNMAAKIDGYLKAGGTYFVVVGAAHFVGPHGVPALLEDRGYAVRQL